MKIKIENVPKVLTIVRISLIALSIFTLLVLDWPRVAVTFATLYVILRFALHDARVRRRVIHFLTGEQIDSK
ncbi:hypothetical protein [Planktotalea arctica]|uniref:hypothetical protein n=1 Tax=Planktotalea arctica TaxID=1481893 RepID=UPI00321A213E